MPRVSVSLLVVGVIAGIVSFAWTADHLPLYNFRILPFGIRAFFLFDAILSIIAGLLFILSFRLFSLKIIYLLEVIYWWINYLLLTLTRVLPAPLVGTTCFASNSPTGTTSPAHHPHQHLGR
ncbi:hypothetical protein [Saccharolobus shibatae]|uniref:Putative integral membrane protein n=1 Tax=Saccharolobus shibatae TaxID=2286 RepID=A0A8F5GYN4_9CREN|nr:hypothetical protein [Saccharolobus shibatae]QXJ34260.1 putative integral membrane protein [Saccharolobus shibatae]